MENNRYLLQKSDRPGYWVVTDRISEIVCVFKEREFNETQKFTFLNEINNIDANEIAKLVNGIGDYLAKNHYKIVML